MNNHRINGLWMDVLDLFGSKQPEWIDLEH